MIDRSVHAHIKLPPLYVLAGFLARYDYDKLRDF
jgi:hypothetical protein